jgi:WD40 repeat protein
VAFSPDGETLVSGSSDTNIRLWRVSDGALLQILEGDTYGINSVAFSKDGSILASGSADGVIRLWRVSDGELLQTLEGHTSPVSSVGFSPDGTTLASSDNVFGTIRLWGVIP